MKGYKTTLLFYTSFIVGSSYRGLQRVASFRPYTSNASRRHASWVDAAGEPAARLVFFFWACGTIPFNYKDKEIYKLSGFLNGKAVPKKLHGFLKNFLNVVPHDPLVPTPYHMREVRLIICCPYPGAQKDSPSTLPPSKWPCLKKTFESTTVQGYTVVQCELDHLPQSRSHTVKNTSAFLAFPRIIAALKTWKTILYTHWTHFSQSPLHFFLIPLCGTADCGNLTHFSERVVL
jgi:hypothetical protein